MTREEARKRPFVKGSGTLQKVSQWAREEGRWETDHVEPVRSGEGILSLS